MKTKTEFRRLGKWPEKPFCGLTEGEFAAMEKLFSVNRFRIEYLRGAFAGEGEVRIPCRGGKSQAGISNLYLADADTGGWIGRGGGWARRVIELLGPDAWLQGRPGAAAKSLATGNDEICLNFPIRRLPEVAKLLRAQKRRRPAPPGTGNYPKKIGIQRGFSGVKSEPRDNLPPEKSGAKTQLKQTLF